MMEQFTELALATIVRENTENGTALVQWEELGQRAEYWFRREDVVHLSRMGSQGVRIGVLSSNYLQAIKDIAFRRDELVDF